VSLESGVHSVVEDADFAGIVAQKVGAQFE
jgi:hypothetical protein